MDILEHGARGKEKRKGTEMGSGGWGLGSLDESLTQQVRRLSKSQEELRGLAEAQKGKKEVGGKKGETDGKPKTNGGGQKRGPDRSAGFEAPQKAEGRYSRDEGPMTGGKNRVDNSAGRTTGRSTILRDLPTRERASMWVGKQQGGSFNPLISGGRRRRWTEERTCRRCKSHESEASDLSGPHETHLQVEGPRSSI